MLVSFGHRSGIDMKKEKIIGIIPARYESQRLPGKPLADINGKPLIYHVWNAAKQSKLLGKILIATDDNKIEEACKKFDAECIMTSGNIKSGSDRIISALQSLNEFYDYVVNIQGDEPLITGELIDSLIEKTINTQADVGTIISPIKDNRELFDSSVVKTVIDDNDFALYFSRSTIPFIRDKNEEQWLAAHTFYKHIGIYCYNNQSLLKFGMLPQSDLEKAEKLEQLRLLQTGAKYICLKTNIPLFGVDTKEDLEKVRKLMKKDLS